MNGKTTRVWIFTPFGKGGEGGIDRLTDEIRFEYAKKAPERLHITFVTTRGGGSILFSPFFLFAALLRITVAAACGRIDIGHLHLAAFGSTWRKWTVARLLRALRVPYILHIHGGNFGQFWDDAPPRAATMIRNMFSHSARVIVLGTRWRNRLAEKMPEMRERITILFNASRAPAAASAMTESPQYIVFLGRLGAMKGVPELTAALETLSPIDGWRATLAGDGEVVKTRTDVIGRGLEDLVDVRSWLSDTEVQNLLQHASILVLPSHEETLPMAIIEGFAHGLAVIATPVGEIPDIVIPEETGLLVAPGDVAGLAAAIRRLLLDPVLCHRLGSTARAFHHRELGSEAYLTKLEALWRASGG